jgi:hypothetical protein
MDSSRTVLRRFDSSRDEAAHLRAVAWTFVFRCWQEKQMVAEHAAEPDGRDAAIVKNKEEVTM